ncbi:MAG TPA: hypothetical protein VHQ90_20845 [Thermoanaerobaculia bacterium]|nr:hypothetical protein [Thermoanaerobaculia bacterium]
MNRSMGTPPPILARRTVLTLLLAAVVWTAGVAWTAGAQQGSPPAAPGKSAAAPAAAPRAGQAGQPRKSAKGGSPATPAMPATPGAPAAPGTAAPGTAAPDLGKIEQILEGDEDVLAGNGFTYDPGNRRDPFKSLLAAQDRPEFRGPRPEGVPGLLIDEIDLKGIFRTAKGFVAQVNSANQKKSFLLKEGDQLYDGDVVRIGRNEVVFKQIVQDPTALKPFREVVKSLSSQ